MRTGEIIFTNVAVPVANVLGAVDKAWCSIEKIIQKAAVHAATRWRPGAKSLRRFILIMLRKI